MGRDFASHETVNHLLEEYVRGDDAECTGAIIRAAEGRRLLPGIWSSIKTRSELTVIVSGADYFAQSNGR